MAPYGGYCLYIRQIWLSNVTSLAEPSRTARSKIFDGLQCAIGMQFGLFVNTGCWSAYISAQVLVSFSRNRDTQSMKPFFLKTGDESGRGRILTDEGQETLSMAQSVLTALVESISNASVTVEILALLRKYRTKLLELLKTTFSTAKEETEANTREEVEKILDERIGEMEEFQAVKVQVVSFVNMCVLIGPGELSLGSKEVFTICTS